MSRGNLADGYILTPIRRKKYGPQTMIRTIGNVCASKRKGDLEASGSPSLLASVIKIEKTGNKLVWLKKVPD